MRVAKRERTQKQNKAHSLAEIEDIRRVAKVVEHRMESLCTLYPSCLVSRVCAYLQPARTHIATFPNHGRLLFECVQIFVDGPARPCVHLNLCLLYGLSCPSRGSPSTTQIPKFKAWYKEAVCCLKHFGHQNGAFDSCVFGPK